MHEYGQMLRNQIKISRLEQRIEDNKAKEQVTGKLYVNRSNRIKQQIEVIEDKQKELADKFDFSKQPNEVMVVFSKLKYRNQCFDEYSKFNRWF